MPSNPPRIRERLPFQCKFWRNDQTLAACTPTLQTIISGTASMGGRTRSKTEPATAENAKPANPETSAPENAAALSRKHEVKSNTIARLQKNQRDGTAAVDDLRARGRTGAAWVIQITIAPEVRVLGIEEATSIRSRSVADPATVPTFVDAARRHTLPAAVSQSSGDDENPAPLSARERRTGRLARFPTRASLRIRCSPPNMLFRADPARRRRVDCANVDAAAPD